MTTQVCRRGAPIVITPRFQGVEVVPDKSRIREELERKIQEFFQAGGRIQQVPAGVSGERAQRYGDILLSKEAEKSRYRGTKISARQGSK